MRTSNRTNNGQALITVLIFVVVYLIITGGLLALVNTEVRMSRLQYESTKAFFLAEAGIERAAASIMDTGGIGSVPASFKLSDTGISDNPYLDGVVINIAATDSGNSMFQVTADATVGTSKRIVTAKVAYNPQSNVFDYAYFLNNWGWFYGSGITANGDVRSNGRFDFKYGPTVEGEVYAGQDIGGGENVQGKAGTTVDGELIYQHPNSPTLNMPNLQNLDYYKTQAQNNNGSVSIGGSTLISGVYGDDGSESGNIVLVGTPSQPIEINGPVVITGDVIISGTVTGQGTIYAGRNLYVVDNLTYGNPPSSPRPASDDMEVINEWVSDNANKDIVGFTATENIVLGDYTSGNWQWLVDNYLFSMGNEDVGKDGIPGTNDTGEGDGYFQSAYEDLDQDGVFDDSYNWPDVQTQTSITNFSNLPPGITKFQDLATNDIGKMEGIFYTNHAMAGWGNGIVFNGAIISKDEAIASYYSVTINYDERLHSRYIDDPNWLIDLGLPHSDRVGILSWWEETP